MTSFTELPAFRPLSLVTVLLVLKMAAVAFATANSRRKSGVVVNPEDTMVNPGSHAEAQEAPATLRAKRAHLNDLENIPAFLSVALLFTLAGGSASSAWIYFGTYLGARTLHTIFYLGEKQPFRTIVWAIGQLTLLGLMVQVLMKVFA